MSEILTPHDSDKYHDPNNYFESMPSKLQDYVYYVLTECKNVQSVEALNSRRVSIASTPPGPDPDIFNQASVAGLQIFGAGIQTEIGVR